MITYSYEKKETLDEAVRQLYLIIKMLRSDQGCPWDREQDGKSVSLNLLDETYEYIDAIIQEDKKGQLEELGDVLLNAMMLLEMREEENQSEAIDAINGVCEKLIRRHPHVFSTTKVIDSTEVIDVWNSIKVEVEGKTHSDADFFSRVPSSLPPLEMANEIQEKIQKVGFDWPQVEGVVEKVKEELGEVVQAYQNQENEQEDLEMELGDLLFSVVNLIRFLGFNPSFALHRSNQKMRTRFNALYQEASKEGLSLNQENLDHMEALWQKIKSEEHLR